MSLHLTQIRHGYGAEEVLRDVSAIVRPRDRVALVGRNGAGKTTLLRIIGGELPPEGGSMSMTSGTRVALHDQRPPLARGVTLGQYVGEGAAAAAALENELRGLERQMAAGNTDARTLAEYGRVQAEFERAGGYAWRSRLEGIARGLGFSPEDLDRQLDTFSGGELTRASLTRALAGEPDLLLLDEPTNHLDVDSIEWLEEYLDGLDASVVFVSHDRWFLESVATSVLELDRGKGRLTKGSYSHWRRDRAERMAQQADQFERQQEELAHLQRFVDRFRYGTKSRQAQSKLKAMARIERVDRPAEERSLTFDFPPPRRSGRVVLDVEGLDVEVAGRTLLEKGSFHIERGQRVALIGRNGSGKTTLLETLLGNRRAPHGKAKLGHNVDVAYYSQQALELPEQAKLVEAVAQGTKLTGPQARTLLGRFLFSGEEAEKQVAVLSGGERRRLALARTVVSGANFLVLDEPTNHLDIESREALEDALQAYPGTVLLVSHDRALIEALATRTIAIEDGRLRLRDGGFGEYARDHEPALQRPEPAKTPAPKADRKPKPPQAAPKRSQRSQRETVRLEQKIEKLEEELGGLAARLSQPDAYDEHSALADDGRRHQAVQEELAYLYREWEHHAG
ncbi:MAG: ATP-binding cassette, subfamily er 3 [Gaiellales bacterium]|nr:ATP-binding cassette, subfamily er 3 [Gaiellales bacterium]